MKCEGSRGRRVITDQSNSVPSQVSRASFAPLALSNRVTIDRGRRDRAHFDVWQTHRQVVPCIRSRFHHYHARVLAPLPASYHLRTLLHNHDYYSLLLLLLFVEGSTPVFRKSRLSYAVLLRFLSLLIVLYAFPDFQRLSGLRMKVCFQGAIVSLRPGRRTNGTAEAPCP